MPLVEAPKEKGARPAAQPAKPAKSAVKANAAIRSDRVNIRNAPSLKASVLFQLNNGDTVYATGKTATDSNGDDWYQIKTSSGKTGWVFGRYIDTTSTDKGASMGDQGKTAPQQQKKPAAETFPVTLKNELDQKVFVALTYYDGNAKDWRCRGWWGVEPHKEMNFKLSHVPGKYIYFYVEGNDGKPLTKSETANGLDWYVTNKKFSYLNGQWENTKLDKPYKGHFVRGSTGDDGWWRLTLN